MKLVRRVLLVGLALVVVAVFALALGIDAAVRKAIEKGASSALGVPTRLDDASLGLLAGELTLRGLRIENPPGFEETPFLELERAHTGVELASLRADVIRIDVVELESVELLLQRRDGKSNYGVILEHLDAGKSQEDPKGDGVRVHIERLVIRDITADFDLLPLGGELTRAKVTIPELVLEDLGNTDEGASVGQITARVVEALLQASLQAGGKVLSPELLGDLSQGLKRLGVGAVDLGQGVLSEVGGALEKVGAGAGKALEDLFQSRKKKD